MAQAQSLHRHETVKDSAHTIITQEDYTDAHLATFKVANGKEFIHGPMRRRSNTHLSSPLDTFETTENTPGRPRKRFGCRVDDIFVLRSLLTV